MWLAMYLQRCTRTHPDFRRAHLTTVGTRLDSARKDIHAKTTGFVRVLPTCGRNVECFVPHCRCPGQPASWQHDDVRQKLSCLDIITEWAWWPLQSIWLLTYTPVLHAQETPNAPRGSVLSHPYSIP